MSLMASLNLWVAFLPVSPSGVLDGRQEMRKNTTNQPRATNSPQPNQCEIRKRLVLLSPFVRFPAGRLPNPFPKTEPRGCRQAQHTLKPAGL